ncbi:MAG: acyl carrier protein [Lachnospiraceae bacterium]|nr:acyl carrier protein [Lachnospiraceae bacterium]
MEYEVLKKAIKTALQVYDAEIQPDSVFATELGADSIDMAQIYRLVEQELKIRIPEEAIAETKTVRDAHEFICKAVAENE